MASIRYGRWLVFVMKFACVRKMEAGVFQRARTLWSFVWDVDLLFCIDTVRLDSVLDR